MGLDLGSAFKTAINPVGLATSFGSKAVEYNLNKRSAKRANEFSERMSSTAYQRGMADMKKAGLNPILAYKLGGASSPSGQMAKVPDLGSAVNTALDASRTESTMSLNEAKKTLTESQARLSKALEPTAEAVSTVTKEVAELVKIIVTEIKSSTGSWSSIIKSAQDTAASWLLKGAQNKYQVKPETVVEKILKFESGNRDARLQALKAILNAFTEKAKSGFNSLKPIKPIPYKKDNYND